MLTSSLGGKASSGPFVRECHCSACASVRAGPGIVLQECAFCPEGRCTRPNWYDSETLPRIGRLRPRHGSLLQFWWACEPGVCAQRCFGRVPTRLCHRPSNAGCLDFVGDIIRRLIARTIAQQISKQVEEATAPHQNALQTKLGCECVSLLVQMLTQLNPRQTVVPVDGVSAFDLVSRNAMLQGLGNMTGGARVLPFVPFCIRMRGRIW